MDINLNNRIIYFNFEFTFQIGIFHCFFSKAGACLFLKFISVFSI